MGDIGGGLGFGLGIDMGVLLFDDPPVLPAPMEGAGLTAPDEEDSPGERQESLVYGSDLTLLLLAEADRSRGPSQESSSLNDLLGSLLRSVG